MLQGAINFIASFPVPSLPNLFNAREKRGGPGIQNHVHDVGPYTRVGRVAGGENDAALSFNMGVKEGHTDGNYLPWRSHTATFETPKTTSKFVISSAAIMTPFCQSWSRDFGSQAPPLFSRALKRSERLGTMLIQQPQLMWRLPETLMPHTTYISSTCTYTTAPPHHTHRRHNDIDIHTSIDG